MVEEGEPIVPIVLDKESARSISDFSGRFFRHSISPLSPVAVRTYLKTLNDKKIKRKERQEYPNKSLQDALDDKVIRIRKMNEIQNREISLNLRMTLEDAHQDILSRIDKERVDIPRSKYILILQRAYLNRDTPVGKGKRGVV